MNKSLIGLVAGIYMIVAIKYFISGEYASGLIWFSYSFANIGFMLL